MAKITIDEWTGVGKSRFVGFDEVIAIDITQEGLIQANYQTTAFTAGSVTNPIDLVTTISTDPASNDIYLSDNNANVYKLNTTANDYDEIIGRTASLTNGSIIWKGFYHVFDANGVDAYDINATGWDNNFVSLTESADWNPSLRGQDDILYWGDGRYVASLQEASGQTYNPATSSTYIHTAQALDLPESEEITTLDELGVNLIIGTDKGNLYTWNRFSDSFDLPIQTALENITVGITVKGIFYYTGGQNNTFYATNGSSNQEAFTIPEQYGNSFLIDNEAIGFVDNKILFGLRNTDDDTAYAHVWAYNINTGELSIEYTVSSGIEKGDRVSAIQSVDSGGKDVVFSYDDADNNKKIDFVNLSGSRYTDYDTKIITPAYQVGSRTNPFAFSEMEYSLSEDLNSGDGIRISFRKSLNDSFTQIHESTFANQGAINNNNFQFFQHTEGLIQFQIELKGDTKLREILVK